VLLGLVVALVTILGYIASMIRRIRKTMRAWELHQAEHNQLMELAHWHEYGRVIPLAGAAPWAPQHRRSRR
jgi:hypothetical protein